MSLELATENETPMKAKKQASKGTPFNDDDQRKRIMDYDLRVCNWNIRALNRDGASAKLAKMRGWYHRHPGNAVEARIRLRVRG